MEEKITIEHGILYYVDCLQKISMEIDDSEKNEDFLFNNIFLKNILKNINEENEATIKESCKQTIKHIDEVKEAINPIIIIENKDKDGEVISSEETTLKEIIENIYNAYI